MDSQEFVHRLKGVCDSVHNDNPSSDSRYAFFLGAGCSVSSGIPAAGALVRESWIPRLCKIKAPHRTDYAAFTQEQFPGYHPDKASSFYGQLIDALFITPNDRQREIEQLCEGKFPGFGYAALSKLVAHKSTAFNVVLTTNFDDLMADALYLYTEARPLVIHHESLASFIRPTRMRPLVVKLHGDSRLSPKNTREKTEDLGENLAKHIAMLLNDRGLIFMGYGGADESILKLLAALPEEALPSGVFWLSPSQPSGKVREWLLKRAGVWVTIADFDEFMLRAYTAFDMRHPSKAEFEKMFGKYYDTFGKMAAKVKNPDHKTTPDPLLIECLAAASKELPEDFKEVARGEALATTKPAEAQKVLEAVAKKPGTSVSAQVQAARTLRDKLHKRREAVVAFESALQMAITDSGEGTEQAQRVRAELAYTRSWTGDLSSAAAEIEKAIAWGESQTPRDESLMALWYSWRSRIRHDRGDLAGAEVDIQKSIDLGEAQAPRDERGLAIRYASRASIRRDCGDLAAAEADIKRSIDWEEAQSPRYERGLAILYASRARIRRDRGMLKEAEDEIAKSISWGEAQSPRDERSLAIWYASLARILQDRGDLAGADAAIKRSINWEEAQAPRDERGLAVLYATRARIRRDRGDLAGAMAEIQKSIDWEEAQAQPGQRELAIRYSLRALIWRDQKQYPNALSDIERSLAWAKAQQSTNYWSFAIVSGVRATILAEVGRVPEALADIAACIGWHRQHLPDNKYLMACFLRDKSRILALGGDWAASAAAISESLRLHEAVFGTDHEWTRKARAWQGTIAANRVPPGWLDTTP